MTLIFLARDFLQFKTSNNSSGFVRAKVAFSRLIGVCFILGLVACSENVTLFAVKKDVDANEIIAVLNRSGIEAQKNTVKDGLNIMVDSKDLAVATEVLTEQGLPKIDPITFDTLCKKDGPISTPLEEKCRHFFGLSQALQSTLLQFDNVITARVHVVLPERVAPGEPIQPSSAAVLIKHRLPFDEDTIVPRIRSLVSASIPGLSEDGAARSKISVVLTPSEKITRPLEWTKVGPFKVHVGSANSLITTLIVLSITSFVSTSLFLGLLIMRNPKIAAKLKGKFVGKSGASKREQVVNKSKNR